MSTKIYDAYRYTGTLDSLFQNLLEMKKQYFEHCFRTLDDFSEAPVVSLKVLLENARIWKDFVDRCMKKPDEMTKIKELNALDLANFLEFMVKSRRCSPLNLEASVVICPFKKKLYAVFFGREIPLIDESRWVDFHYQNSTDRPKEVSQRQWNHREEVWDAIAERGASFVDDGLVFRFVDEDNVFNLAFEYYQKRKMTDLREIENKD